MPGSDGKSGDAYVEISVRPHSGFRREGHDILSTLPVSLGEARAQFMAEWDKTHPQRPREGRSLT
jgi:DnaJ-class molecular chaperone